MTTCNCTICSTSVCIGCSANIVQSTVTYPYCEQHETKYITIEPSQTSGDRYGYRTIYTWDETEERKSRIRRLNRMFAKYK
jgi:hypothetical protein